MGWFARLLRGKRFLWDRFEGLGNNEATLALKGTALAPALVEVARQLAEDLRRHLLPKTDLATLHLECLALDIHLVDRLTFQALGGENRNSFQDALIDAVALSLEANPSSPQFFGKASMAFLQLYNQRTMQYMDCEIAPPKNERGGLALEQALGWRLAEHLGVSDELFIRMKLEVSIAAHYIAMVEHLQIRELLVGYRER